MSDGFNPDMYSSYWKEVKDIPGFSTPGRGSSPAREPGRGSSPPGGPGDKASLSKHEECSGTGGLLLIQAGSIT